MHVCIRVGPAGVRKNRNVNQLYSILAKSNH